MDLIVIVNVFDANDNVLEFIYIKYFIVILENIFRGVSIVKVSVIDIDSGENGYIIYFLDR